MAFAAADVEWVLFQYLDRVEEKGTDGASLQLLPPGMVTRPTGAVQTVDGIELEVREAVPGYHVNVRTTSVELAAALEALRTNPVTPVRVWA